ncbi:MAG: S1 RNA-binding domain-containing protein, partial [Betaproteobacteria bacterium]
IHISALAEKFVKDAHDVVKAGQVVKVKVLEVDIKRQRVALTMRLNDTPTRNTNPRNGGGFLAKPSQTARQLASLKSAAPAGGNAMAEAFAKLRAKT